MASANPILTNFTAGEWSPALRGRVDHKKYYNACETLENMICRAHGPAFRRPGTYFVQETLGRDHVTNGTFEEDDHWTKGTGWTIADNHAVGALGTASDLSQDPEDLVEGETYQVIWTMADSASGTVTCEIGGTEGTARSTNATFTEEIVCGADTDIVFSKSDDFDGKITNVFVRQVAPVTRLESFEFSTTQAYVLAFTDQNLRIYKDNALITSGGVAYEVSMPYLEAELFEFQVTQSADTMYLVHPSYAPRKLTRTGHTAWTLTTIEFTAGVGEQDFSEADNYPACCEFYEERMIWAGWNDGPQTLLGSVVGDYEDLTVGTDDADAFEYTINARGVNRIRWLVPQNVLLVGTVGAEWKVSSGSTEEPLTVSTISAKRQSAWGSKDFQAILVNDVALFVQRAGTKVRELTEDPNSIYSKYISPDLTILAEHITESGVVDMAYQQEPASVLWCVRDDGVLATMTYERTQDVVGWHRQITDDGNDLFESIAIITTTGEDEVWVSVKRTINGVARRYIEYFKPWGWGTDRKDCFFVDSGLTSDGGDSVTITGITQADPGVVTAASHGFSDGEFVKILSVVGMTEVNERYFIVANKTDDTFELTDEDGDDVDTSGFTAYTSGGTVQVFAKDYTGLDHLVGETVDILADGGVVASKEVDADGEITLDDYANKIQVGLPITWKLQPMNIEAGASLGTAQGKTKRVHSLSVRFQDTMACQAGPDMDHLEDINFTSDSDPSDEPTPLYTGDKKINKYPGGYGAGTILLTGSTPLPCTVVAIMPQLKTNDSI
ncbi:hypothetical protein K9N50_10745 [bacterium]|nr:hypothetical protein [bacterium]